MYINKIKNRQIAEEAASWAVHIDHDNLTSNLKKELTLWLKESPTHVEELLLATSLIFGISEVDKQKKIEIEKLIEQIDPKVVPFDSANNSSATTKTTKFRQAASLKNILPSMLALSAVMLVVLTMNLSKAPVNSTLEPTILHTQVGEQRSLTLEDGSTIFLNTDSHIKVNYSQNSRVIELSKGEALFKVTHDPKRPFQVYSDGSMTQAIGTVFNVLQTTKGTEIAVVEGKVFVKPVSLKNLDASNRNNLGENIQELSEEGQQDKFVLTVGEQVSVDQHGSFSVKVNQDLDKITSWRMRRLIFKSESLQSIAKEFNRYNHSKIMLDDSSLRAIKFSGVFDANDPHSFVKFLELSGGIKIAQVSDSEIHLKYASSPDK